MKKKETLSPYRIEWHVNEEGYCVGQDLNMEDYCFSPESIEYDPESFLENVPAKRGIGFGEFTCWDECGEPWIIAKHGSYKRRMYDPMQIRSLHREFANISVSKDGEPDYSEIISFASKYGFLGAMYYVFQEPNEQLPRRAESLQFWSEQVLCMRQLLELLDDSRSEQSAKEHWLRWVREQLIKFDELKNSHTIEFARLILLANTDSRSISQYIQAYIIETGTGSSVSSSFKYSQVAKLILHIRLNRLLNLLVRPSVQIEPNANIMLMPKNLLGAMYALLAEEIIGVKRPIKKCPGCGKWFQPLDARKSTCSDKCKKREWRNKQKEKGNV